jgi:D-glycero-alpha-D-manno-heptose 1-phosphate guanylyltransferase
MLPIVILCGGLGTRLRSVVNDQPKVLAPVKKRPFLMYIIDHLRSQGLGENIWLSTGYLADQLSVFAESVDQPEQRVRCIEEKERLGTGGALRFVVKEAAIEGPFLALNGDTWFDAPLRTLAVESMVRNPGEWVVALTTMKHSDRYGTVVFDPKDRKVLEFTEKHTIGSDAEWINAGVYLAWSSSFVKHDFPDRFSLETEGFPQLMKHDELYARPFPTARFLDIGIPEDYAKAEAIL